MKAKYTWNDEGEEDLLLGLSLARARYSLVPYFTQYSIEYAWYCTFSPGTFLSTVVIVLVLSVEPLYDRAASFYTVFISTESIHGHAPPCRSYRRSY